MILRRALLALALCALAPTAARAEGGPMLSGEHDSFSRLVMRVDPETEWSLSTSADTVTVFFPGTALEFDLRRVFEKIPRDRIASVSSSIGEAGTSVEIGLACGNCRVSTVYVDGRWLALDVADPDAPPIDAGSTSRSQTVEAPDDPDRQEREDAAVTAAEDILLRQIERAADQGIIDLGSGNGLSPTEPVRSAPPGADMEEDAFSAPTQPQAPQFNPGPALPVEKDTLSPGPGASLQELLDHDQIRAITVFDRDRPDGLETLAEAAEHPACVEDALLDMSHWSSSAPFMEQRARLERNLLGEFDAVNPEALLALTRLYVRHGFGYEAEALLAAFPAPVTGRAALIDLARVVDGRRPATGGPLLHATDCDGRHALWSAVAGKNLAPAGSDRFDIIHGSFEELPPDLRRLVGPALVAALLEAGHVRAARITLDTMTRDGRPDNAELALSRARLAQAEGDQVAALEAFAALAETNPPNLPEVMIGLAESALAADEALSDEHLAHLRSVAMQARGSGSEARFRALVARSLAKRGELDEALSSLANAMAELSSDTRFAPLAADIIAAARPEDSGPAAYAEAILSWSGLLLAGPEADHARRMAGRHLIDLSLAQSAMDLLAPPVQRGDAPARLLAAEAHLMLGETDAADGLLAGLQSAAATQLRASILAHDEQYSEAVALLDSRKLSDDAARYAWPSGDWPRARAEARAPEQRALAAYMEARTEPEPADGGPKPALTAQQPATDPPSLAAARQLVATGQEVGAFVSELLEEN